MLGNTMAAVATAAGTGGISIIRISGDEALKVLEKAFMPAKCHDGNKENYKYEPRKLVLGNVMDENSEIIDQALAVYMPGPNSYTGEDVCEIQCHGGYVVTQEILGRIFALGAVPAEAGEFTSRAFINGRMSLDQAEAVIDIIEAKSSEALRISERQLSGKMSAEVGQLCDNLLNILAELELAIDYPEETDGTLVSNSMKNGLDGVLEGVENLLKKAKQGKFYSQGVQTAIIGEPNAGKSTLLNAILEEERAIVTPIAGTTRDTVEEFYNLNGLPLRLVDTAGIRDTDDIVEQAGVERSKKALLNADLIFMIVDSSRELTDFITTTITENAHRPLLIVLNKQDLGGEVGQKISEDLKAAYPEIPQVAISAAHGDGIEELKTAVFDIIMEGSVNEPLSGLINERQKSALLRGKEHLCDGLSAYEMGISGDMIAIDIQSAWEALSEISGGAAADDIIDRVFSRFCLGK